MVTNESSSSGYQAYQKYNAKYYQMKISMINEINL